jgi:drug/metabolite transporter (DMT)-like permease
MDDKNLKGHISLLIAYIIFGLNTPIAKEVLMHGEVSADALTFYRMAGATVLFWITSLFTKKERVSLHDLFMLFVASMFGILINQMAFIIGLSRTSPIDASVITTIAPILTMLLAAFFLKEPITWKKAIGVFIGASGALLLILNSNTTERGSASIAGNLLCLLSGFAFALYLTAFKKLILQFTSITLMKWMFLFSTLCCFPFCWGDVSQINYTEMTMDMYLKIIFVVVLATFVSYLLIPIGQKFLRPTIVSMYNYLHPIVSSFLAVFLGMDIFGWAKSCAALLVFLGVYIVTKSKSYAQMEAEKRLHRHM